MPDIFAVFEGGGVKGIGHVGALAQIGWSEPSLKIRGYAGASAGAIVAALAAAGFEAAGPDSKTEAGPDSMKTILAGMDFAKLLDGLNEVPLKTIQDLEPRLTTVVKELTERSNKINQSGRIKKAFYWNLLGQRLSKLVSQNADIITACRQLWEHKGVYGTVKFRDWIDGLLKRQKHLIDADGKVTFKSIEKGTKGTILKVVVTDIAGRAAKTYGPGPNETPREEVADAVLASMTIPLFFRPFAFGPHNFYVDGGLLSNFPAWLFDDENDQREQAKEPRLPLLGIRLVAARPVGSTNVLSTQAFLWGLVATKLEGADFLQTRLINRFAAINVQLPAGLNAWDFNLTDEVKNSLFDRGTIAAQTSLIEPANRLALGI